ncbi:MAG TPA: MFS transporter [Microbacterium sp.]|nr:MFS transporter [Microbacterium sp.]
MLTQFTAAARLDRLPIAKTHRLVIATLAVVFLFEFGDLNTFAYVAPALQQAYGFTVTTIAIVTSSGFLGMFFGATLGGRFSDAAGRRTALLTSTIAFSAGSLLNAFAWDQWSFMVVRFITGVGLSAMTVAATTYVSETMPAARRGRMQAAVMAVGLLGIPVISFAARAIIPISAESWRFVFVVGALAVVAIPGIVRMPESPRWLLRHGHDQKAERALQRFESPVADLPPLAEAPATPLGTVTVALTTARPGRGGYRVLFRGLAGRRTLFLSVVWIFQTLGFYGFTAFVPTLLVAHGFDLVHSIGFAAMTSLGAVPGALLAWPISDRFGRKTPLVIVCIATAVSGILYGITFNVVAIVAFGFCVNVLIQTFAALLYTYTPELFPTEVRNSGSGFTYGMGRLVNIVGPFIVAALFGSLGYQSVFIYIAACWLIVAVTIAIFGPRSGKVTLEDLSERREDPKRVAATAGSAS